MNPKVMKIGQTKIGEGHETFIIAEISANHGGSIQTAFETIKAIKRTGANAVKLQTYTADTITLDCESDDFKVKHGTIWDGTTLHKLYQQAYTPWEWHKELFHVAKEEGLECFSSPFDHTAVEFLEELKCPAYKIASFEITDIPLIKLVASKGKPVIISTGIAKADDIKLAVDTCRSEGVDQIALLKCTSSYPAPINEANIVMIKDLAQRYNVISGLSDHTLGETVPIAAVSLGAKIIEKHFILDKNIGGPDASFSLDFNEFTSMVRAVREAEMAIGKIDYELTEKQEMGRYFARSLYVAESMNVGDIINYSNIRSVRPGRGLHPKYTEFIQGKRVNRNLSKGTPMSLDYLGD